MTEPKAIYQVTRVCQNCQIKFKAKSKKAKFCGVNCRNSFNQKLKRDKQKALSQTPVKKFLREFNIYFHHTAVIVFASVQLIFAVLLFSPRIIESVRAQKTRSEQFKKIELVKLHLNALLNPDNKWLTNREIKAFKETAKVEGWELETND